MQSYNRGLHIDRETFKCDRTPTSILTNAGVDALFSAAEDASEGEEVDCHIEQTRYANGSSFEYNQHNW